jgi:hypothetical protein
VSFSSLLQTLESKVFNDGNEHQQLKLLEFINKENYEYEAYENKLVQEIIQGSEDQVKPSFSGEILKAQEEYQKWRKTQGLEAEVPHFETVVSSVISD